MAGNRSELRRVKKGIGVDYYFDGGHRFLTSIDAMFYDIHNDGGVSDKEILEEYFVLKKGGYTYRIREKKEDELRWD